ncbi:MAG: RIP metalloprotease RseP [Acidobacteria bacterium]|nr:RIP metalloprotease RseP [Acidobacteriota bacterium]
MLETIITGLIVLGLMVLVHEWGHFLAAKLFGIRVDVFSIGFGPRLFGRKRGATDYRVSALPLGGYVKMAGDTPGEEHGSPDEFLSKPRWQRAGVVLAGPLMNLLLAVLLLAALFTYHYERPAFYEQPAVIGAVLPNSPAAAAGLEVGDRIVALDDLQNPRWRHVLVQTAISVGQPVRVVVERAGERLAVEIVPRAEKGERVDFAGWLPQVPPMVRGVISGSPAEQAGLEAGDVLLALNGQQLNISSPESESVSDRIQKLQGVALQLTIARGGAEQTLSVQPTLDPQEKRWTIGVWLGPQTITEQLSPWQALRQSVAQNWETTGWIGTLLARLVTGRASLRSLEGPVGIVRRSGEAARIGLAAVVNLMVLISLSLGLLNLLPIPILDGGHLLLLAVEGSLQRDLSLVVKERMIQVGFLFLMLIFAIVMYNDIARLFGG